MSLYELPGFPKINLPNFAKSRTFWLIVLVIFSSSFFGFLAGAVSSGYFYFEVKNYLGKFKIDLPNTGGQTVIQKEYLPQTSQEQAIIDVVKRASPAVVSIVITKDVPIMEEYYVSPFGEFFGDQFPGLQVPQYRQKGVEKKEIGGGTGFIVSEDGMILTNKHVVLDPEAEYTVFTNDSRKFPAKVLARDPIQDLAVLKIDQEKIISKNGDMGLKPFAWIALGDSLKLQIGQTVIAIGNSLGEFRNTVSVGVISGLGRTITASGGGSFVETLEDVIQTDAAINKGNSGGPLLNLKGEVIGINVATVLDAQNIGFSIPANKAARDIKQVKDSKKIVYPFLGVRYIIINEQVKKEYKLSVDYGALIVSDGSNPAVVPGSSAEKAGLKENDVILTFGGEKITPETSLTKIIQQYAPQDRVSLKILRSGAERTIEVVLGVYGE